MTERISKHEILDLAAAYASVKFTKCLNSEHENWRELAGLWNLIAETLEREGRKLQEQERANNE